MEMEWAPAVPSTLTTNLDWQPDIPGSFNSPQRPSQSPRLRRTAEEAGLANADSERSRSPRHLPSICLGFVKQSALAIFKSVYDHVTKSCCDSIDPPADAPRPHRMVEIHRTNPDGTISTKRKAHNPTYRGDQLRATIGTQSKPRSPISYPSTFDPRRRSRRGQKGQTARIWRDISEETPVNTEPFPDTIVTERQSTSQYPTTSPRHPSTSSGAAETLPNQSLAVPAESSDILSSASASPPIVSADALSRAASASPLAESQRSSSPPRSPETTDATAFGGLQDNLGQSRIQHVNNVPRNLTGNPEDDLQFIDPRSVQDDNIHPISPPEPSHGLPHLDDELQGGESYEKDPLSSPTITSPTSASLEGDLVHKGPPSPLFHDLQIPDKELEASDLNESGDLVISSTGDSKLLITRDEIEAEEAAIKATEDALAAQLAAEAEAAALKASGGRRKPRTTFPARLSEVAEHRVSEAHRAHDGAAIVTNLEGTSLTSRDFRTVLDSTAWLNDEIVNAYLAYLSLHANTKAGRLPSPTTIPSVVAQSSFFYKTLAEKGPGSVARWMSRKKAGGQKLLDVDAVLIPVNNHSHWTLLVVSPKKRTVEYMDSFRRSPDEYVDNVFKWLKTELGSNYDASEWTVLDPEVTQQKNGYDCGVFLLTNAECVVAGLETSCYRASAMAAQRRRVAAVLLYKGFDSEHGLVVGDGGV